jgi:hypothetical protein
MNLLYGLMLVVKVCFRVFVRLGPAGRLDTHEGEIFHQ